ncbi:ABC transporter ATP-binding protein, partial [Escherichia coli]|nr:ABC transporter ATP-binding protein [Escherichia coli]
TIFGKDVASLSRRELATNVAVVAQENETKFPITVFQYVLSGRYSHSFGFGPDSSEDIAAVQNAIALCNLSGYDNRLMNELSGG